MRDYLKRLFVDGEILQNSVLKWVCIIFAVITLFIIAKTLISRLFKEKGAEKRYFSNYLKKYSELTTKYLNLTAKYKMVAVAYLLPSIMFVVSVICFLIGIEVIKTPLNETALNWFCYGGLILFAICYFGCMAKQFTYSENAVPDLGYLQQEYLPPDIVTITTYEKWDFQPDYEYTQTGVQTVDLNAGKNAEIAANNFVGHVFQLVSFVVFTLSFMIVSLIDTIYILSIIPFNKLRIAKAEKLYNKYLNEIANSKSDKFGNLYVNWNIKNPAEIIIERKVNNQLLGDTIKHLENGDENFMAFLYCSSEYKKSIEVRNLTRHIKTTKVRNETCYMYENTCGKLITIFVENKSGKKFSTYFIPYGNDANFIAELNKCSKEAKQSTSKTNLTLFGYTRKLEYYYLEKQKQLLSGDVVVGFLDMDINNVKYVKTKLSNVTLNPETETFTVNIPAPATNAVQQTGTKK